MRYLYVFFVGGEEAMTQFESNFSYLKMVDQSDQENHLVSFDNCAILDYGSFDQVIEDVQKNPRHQYKMIFDSRQGSELVSRMLKEMDFKRGHLSNLEMVYVGCELLSNWSFLPIDTWILFAYGLTEANKDEMCKNNVCFKTLPLLINNAVFTERNEIRDSAQELIWISDCSDSSGFDECSFEQSLSKLSERQKVFKVLMTNPKIFSKNSVLIYEGLNIRKFGILENSRIQEVPFEPDNDGDVFGNQKTVSEKPDQIDVAREQGAIGFFQESTGQGKRKAESENFDAIQRFFNGDNVKLLISGGHLLEISKLIASQYCIDHRDRIFVVLSDKMTPGVLRWVLELHHQGYFNCIVAREKEYPTLMLVTDKPSPKVQIAADILKTYLNERNILDQVISNPCQGLGCQLM